MKTLAKVLALGSILGLLALPVAKAVVMAVDLGTAAPPATLGGYAVAPFEPGTIVGESYTAHETNGNCDSVSPLGWWSTWGQSYTGFVHVRAGTEPLTLNLTNVQAIYFYMEPNQFSDFTMTATDLSGVSVSTIINGYHGSSGVGFYETDPLDSLSKIVVTCSDLSGFAVGEFGINEGGQIHGSIGVPDASATALLLLLGLAGVLGCRRFRRA